jgi:hypothetical protein
MLGVVLFAVVGVVAPATHVKAEGKFHGTYAWTGFRSCVLANQPFVTPNFLIPAGAFLSRQDSSESGTITFNRDGTGVTRGRASLMTFITPDPDPTRSTGVGFTAAAGLSVAEFENHFTFTVTPDAIIETESTGVTATTVLPVPGATTTGIGLHNRFQIVRGDMLVSAPQTEINPEQIVLATGATLHRICTPHSFTAKRLP